jgi:5-methylcytosine-specific restriction endonuclease McrA
VASLLRIIAGHPLQTRTPYNAIKFARVDHMGTPLYTVAKGKKQMGAAAALALAMEKMGGHCFHCGDWMPPQKLSQTCTRDHVWAKGNGGPNFLHNLVFACGKCNRGKASLDVVEFRPESGSKYLRALSEHLARCVEQLAKG